MCDDRQNHANRRTILEFALGFDAAAVELGDMFHNCQTEAGAPNAIVAARFVDAVEALKNARQLVFGNPNSIVAHAQDDFLVALPGNQPNFAMLTRIFHGVVEQIV